MSNNTQPEIRFPGFTEDWEQRKLGDFIDVKSGKDYKHLNSGSIPVYGTGGYMLSVDRALSDIDAIGIGRKGTIDKPYLLKAPFWTVDTLFYAVPKQNIDLQFSLSIFKKINWKKFDESTGVPSLSKTVINSVGASVPSYEEQQKIGSFFKQLDETIALHQRKLDLLKETKKGFLQKMFPKNGAKVPEIRFPGFTEDWEQRRLSDVASIVGGGTPSTSNPEYWDGDIDWYAPAEIGDQIYVSKSLKTITELGQQKSSAKILPIGTVLFTSRAGIGNTAILAKEGTTNQGFQSIVPHKNKLDSYFIFSRTHELKRYGEVTGAGSTFAEVSGKQMAKMPILIPCINEQRKIGAFFEQLDTTITLHQRELDVLKETKKGFLQKMFV
ncbi:restriction endonuclease subunit S [Enterococcus hirae]|uniref:restriction endonuclease subunit S n=1 Tax=Enterococcus hirae TaxID=1354 RepID=UPI0021E84A9D|nr:restriction endonuclease subunit S [Enterococcus hirae]MCV3107432.1 restriction endonuclease subunit S [Enterococcus hirae]MCV3114911.1 restriction endonuclease subunit S [Enterococcus hirae]MCV3129966.1 restriction endonuclease subunit S [Enterococcus hirae]MCV3132420.1 restriction endonuclease subunit S [Enterococcus hirae]